MKSGTPAQPATAEPLPSNAGDPAITAPALARAVVQPWWRTRRVFWVLLLVVVVLGGYFRTMRLADWDGGQLLHPDERFFTEVSSTVRLPARFSDYLDASRAPSNPRNVGKTFFVYGTFPMLLTRLVAVSLTPPDLLPAEVENTTGLPDADGDGMIANVEHSLPRVPVLPQLLNPDGKNLTVYGEIQVVGRWLVALFDLASLVVIALIGRALFGWREGLLAALLAAVTVTAIQQSHFYVDPIFSTFFALLTLYGGVQVARGGGVGWYLLLGFGVGMATANRITLAALGVVAVVAAILGGITRWRRQYPDGTPPPGTPSLWAQWWLHAFPLLVLAGVLALLVFRVAHPYAFVGSQPDSPPLSANGDVFAVSDSPLQGAGFFDVRPSPRFLDNMRSVQRLVTGVDDFPPSQQWVNRTAYLFPWQNIVLWGMGPALGITAWAAWATAGVLLVRRAGQMVRAQRAAQTLAPFVLWFWVAFYFAWQGGQFASTMRYMLPIYGALTVLAAWLLVAAWERGAPAPTLAPAPAPAPARLTMQRWQRAGRWLLRALPVVVVLLTVLWAWSFTRIYTRDHSRVAAAHWAAENIPPGATIASEVWDDPLPLQVTGNYLFGTVYQGIDIAPYSENDPRSFFGEGGELGILDKLDEADYITITSNRVYDSTQRLPMRYPATMRYYHHLFSGALGFELVAEFTSYPSLLGVPIPDYTAEEAFSVYDHPRVHILAKTPAYSRERAEELITEPTNWGEVFKSPVAVADRAPTALRLTTSAWESYQQAATNAPPSAWQRIVSSDWLAPFVWFFVLEAIGLAAFALFFHLVPWLPDRGFSLARIIGLLLVAYTAWLAGSLHWLPFTPLTVWLCAAPLLLLGGGVAWLSRHELLAFARTRRQSLLWAQGIYLGAFVALLVVRWLNPDLWHPARGGEKPMDFAYLNAVLNSPAFPPYDPWFAGGYINYYYFGFVLVGALVHLTGITAAVGYNLAVVSLFALTALGAWGIVYNLLAPRYRGTSRERPAMRRIEQRALLAAGLAPLFTVLLGSLVQAVWFVNGYAANNAGRPEWAFWDATRIIEGTVNEFPFFTFLFADLHAHMMVMPLSLAVVGVLVALVRVPRLPAPWAPYLLLLPLLGLLLGALRATNTWDYPTFGGLIVATLALLAWWAARRAWQQLPAPAPARQREAVLLVARQVGVWLVQVAVVLLLGNVLFHPFVSHFATESSGVDLWIEGQASGTLMQVANAARSPLWSVVQIYGFWLLVLVGGGALLWLRVPGVRGWQATGGAVVAGIALACGVIALLASTQPTMSAPLLLLPLLIAAVGLLYVARRLAPRRLLPVLWGSTALALLVGVEYLVVRGDIGRMNTVFKFGLHSWLLFALAAAVTLPWAWRVCAALPPPSRVLSWVWRATAAVLLLAGLVYPLTATPARIADRFMPDLPRTLDGTAYMPLVETSENGQVFRLADDAAAIAWLREHVDGRPVVLEAHLPAYRWGGRVAIHTGLPTLLGWEWHQIQQRTAAQSNEVIANRQDTIRTIYDTTDPLAARDLLHQYGIAYVYVGALERAVFTPDGITKFDLMEAGGYLAPVYQSGDGLTTIYRVTDHGVTDHGVTEAGASSIATADTPVVAPTHATIPALVLDVPVQELPIVADYAWNSAATANHVLAVLLWLLVWYGIALLGVPLAVLLFGGWHDGGWGWARLWGWLLLGYAVWLPTSLRLWHYDGYGVLAGAVVVVLLNVGLLAWLGWQQHGTASVVQGARWLVAHLRARWRAVALVEGLFTGAVLLFVGIRALNPDLWHPVWGGEKPMELGFINAILRSAVMPPYDPFFSDGYINYYYYGLYLVTLPMRLTGIAPAVAYNLAVPTLFALLVSGAYLLVRQMSGRVLLGIVGAVAVGVLGNFAAVVPAGWSQGGAPVLAQVQQGNLADMGAALGDWYIGPSRVIEFTINEFPFWSFLYGDLHPHVIALPLALLAAALALQVAMSGARGGQPLRLWAVAGALLLGTLATTNSWDFPTYGLLLGLTLLVVAWHRSPDSVPWLTLVQYGALAAAMGAGGLLLFSPFFDMFYPMVRGVGLVETPTRPHDFVLLYGLFLAVLLPVIFGLLARFVVAWRGVVRGRVPALMVGAVLPGLLLLLTLAVPAVALQLWLAVLISACVVLVLWRGTAVAVWFPLLLALVGWLVALGVDTVYIRDHLAGTDWYRMNTVFKFGLHIWLLLALAAAATLPVFWQVWATVGRRLGGGGARWLPAAATTALAGLALVAALFPLVGTASRVANRFAPLPPTLDGLAFLQVGQFSYDCNAFGGCEPGAGTQQIDLASDAAAIAWLNETLTRDAHVNGTGTPVIVQAPTSFYRAYGIRIAANTGFPTVISGLHVNEQRDGVAAARREQDIDQLYRATDTEPTLRLLAAYNIDYVYVGAIERAVYPAAGLQKFAAMDGRYLDMVYDEPGATIYRVGVIPPDFSQPQPASFVPEPGTADAAAEPAVVPGTDDETLLELEEQVAQFPDDAGLAFGLAERYRVLGRYDDAANVLATAAASNPDNIGLHHLWGDILNEAGRSKDAEQVLRGIAERAPNAGNWNKLAVSLYEAGQLEKASAALKEALRSDDTVPEPYFWMGRIALQQGDTSGARYYFEQYLVLDPEGFLAGETRMLMAELE